MRNDVAELLADLDEQLENVAAIALAAGLGADATAAEVVARVGEMRGALVGWATDAPRSADALDALADRLATEAGRA